VPPKIKFTSQMVIDTAFEIVRSDGWQALSARNIANKLNSSVGPIYSYVKSMGALEGKLLGRAYRLLYQYMTEPRTDDRALDRGVGYVLFARDEKNLFECFIDKKFAAQRRPYSEQLWQSLDDEISIHSRYRGLTKEKFEQHRRKMVTFTYGLAVLIHTGFLDVDMGEKQIIELLRETGEMLLAGLRASLE